MSHTERIWPDKQFSHFHEHRAWVNDHLSSASSFHSPFRSINPMVYALRCKDEDVIKTAQFWECSECTGSPWIDSRVSLANSGPSLASTVFPQHIFQHAVLLAWLQHHITTHIPLRHPGTLRKAVERQHAHLFLLLYCPAVSIPSSCSIKYLPSFVNNTTQTFIKSNYTLSLSFAKLNILNPVYVWGKQKIVPYLSSS